jgi:hypothetical protein
MTGPEELRIIDTTDALLDARRTGNAIADLPANLQPGRRIRRHRRLEDRRAFT